MNVQGGESTSLKGTNCSVDTRIVRFGCLLISPVAFKDASLSVGYGEGAKLS